MSKNLYRFSDRNLLTFFKSLKMYIRIDLTFLVLGIYPKESIWNLHEKMTMFLITAKTGNLLLNI